MNRERYAVLPDEIVKLGIKAGVIVDVGGVNYSSGVVVYSASELRMPEQINVDKINTKHYMKFQKMKS